MKNIISAALNVLASITWEFGTLVEGRSERIDDALINMYLRLTIYAGKLRQGGKHEKPAQED